MKRSRITPAREERAGLYVRVSLDRSARGLQDEILSPETQEDRGRQYCGAQGWTVAAVERDIDESGYSQHYSERQGLNRLLRLVEGQQLTKIVVWKFSRLSRRLREFIEICDRVEAAGGGVVSVTEQVDTSTPAGRLIRNILASFAQFQSEEISEQIFETWLTKARRGERPPGAAPFGTVNRKGILEPDPAAHEHLVGMFRAFRDTGSIRSVWDWLTARGVPAPKAGAWNLTTIRGILTNPVYVGQIAWAGQVFEARWAPLVAPALWQEVQDLLGARRTGPVGRRGDQLLTGLVRCSLCGQSMWTRYARRSEGLRRVYWCASRSDHRRGCRLPAVDAEELEAAVWAVVAQVVGIAGLEEAVAAEAERAMADGGHVRRRRRAAARERLESAAAALAGLLAEGSITREQYARQNEKYRRQLESLSAEAGAPPAGPDALLEAARGAVEGLAAQERRQLLLALGVRVEVAPRRVELRALGLQVNLKARCIGEIFHFGEAYQRLDCSSAHLTDKQVAFIRHSYRWADKRSVAARLGRSYATLVTVARRLRRQGVLDRKDRVLPDAAESSQAGSP